MWRGDGAIGGRDSIHAGARFDGYTGAGHVEAIVDQAVVGAERDVAQSWDIILLVIWLTT